MKSLVIALTLCFAACVSRPPNEGPQPVHYPEAMAIVERVAAKHKDAVRLSIHAVPREESKSRVVASSLPAKLDDWSDPEDLRAMETKQPVTMREGANLDYTLPVIDRSGAVVAAVGVTVRGSDEKAMLASAETIAREVAGAILEASQPLW